MHYVYRCTLMYHPKTFTYCWILQWHLLTVESSSNIFLMSYHLRQKFSNIVLFVCKEAVKSMIFNTNCRNPRVGLLTVASTTYHYLHSYPPRTFIYCRIIRGHLLTVETSEEGLDESLRLRYLFLKFKRVTLTYCGIIQRHILTAVFND